MAWLNFCRLKFPSVSRRVICVVISFFINFVICVNSGRICVRNPPTVPDIGVFDADSFYTFLCCTKLFVDRTEFITRFVTEDMIINGVEIIAFPRRFGKSMNMLQLQFFFGIEIHPAHGTEVSQEKTNAYQFFTTGKLKNLNGVAVEFTPAPQISDLMYRKLVQTHCAKYPVIYVDFKSIVLSPDDTYDTFLKLVGKVIRNTFESHRYLKEYLSDKLDAARPFEYEGAKDNLDFFMNGLNKKLDSHMLETSIEELSKILRERFSNRKVIILIDEYDQILSQVYLHDKQFPKKLKEDILTFFRRFYASTLTANKANYHRAILTGLMNIQLSNIFSGLNYPSQYNMFSPTINRFYGISAEEADQLFDKYPSITKDQRMIIKNYYDGYKFSTSDGKFERFYNTYSIVNYLNYFESHPDPDGYWAGSGVIDGNIREMMMIDSVKNKLETLLSENCNSVVTIYNTLGGNFKNTGYLKFTIEEIRSLEEMSNSRSLFKEDTENHADTFLKLLVATGYLTWDGKDSEPPGFIFPNKEVSKHMLSHYVKEYKNQYGHTYIQLARELRKFVFDDNLDPKELVKAFMEYTQTHQHELLPHIPPSKRGKTAVIPTGENSMIVVNEAYFSSIFRSVCFWIWEEDSEKTFVAFEHQVTGGDLDLYFHNFKDKEAIMELKYQGSGKNINHAMKQISQYKTNFESKQFKKIAVLGKKDGSIEVQAEFVKV